MKWSDVREIHPHKWVLIKAIDAITQNGLRIVNDLEVLNVFEDGSNASKEYATRHKLNKNDEMYVYHSSKDSLDISERVWIGVRKND